MNININDIIDTHPIITINTYGAVANGKSSLIKNFTGISPMKFKTEIIQNKTTQLGYTNAKIYKCLKCVSPNCYQINKQTCKICNEENKLILHISIVDSPGHNNLQTTALKSLDIIDFCLLLFSVEGGSTNSLSIGDHYRALKYFDLLDKTFILQNKIDLVSKDIAYEQYDFFKKNYEIDTIVPISAQYGYGINYLIQLMVEKIKIPTNEQFNTKINLSLKANIIRSFDINKQNIDVKNLQGGVTGIYVKEGTIKIGDTIKIVPGLIMKDGTVKNLIANVTSIKTDTQEVNIAYPCGLYGIGLSLDPTLTINNFLDENIIISENDELLSFKEGTIMLNNDNHQLTVNTICVLLLGSIKKNIKIIKKNKNEITFVSSSYLCAYVGDKILILLMNKIHTGGKITSIL